MTRQIKDVLIYEGNEYPLNQTILEPYFKRFPEKKPESDVVCTALWRGYIATFEIVKDELLIKDLDVFQSIKPKLTTYENIFPDNKFSWYSGLIRIDKFRGEFDDEAEDATFEYLEIYRGVLIQKRVMNYTELCEFKAEQFEYFKETEAYKEVFNMWLDNNPKMSHKKINEYIFSQLIQNHLQEVF